MARKITLQAANMDIPRLSQDEVRAYLSTLGYTNIVIDKWDERRVDIEADLAGHHYIASANDETSLSAAEKIMTGYWVALTKDDPFDMPADGSARIDAGSAEEDGYAATLDD